MSLFVRTMSIPIFSLLVCGGASAAITSADLMVLMDESSSMSGEQNWIKGAITSLDSNLMAVGVNGKPAGKRRILSWQRPRPDANFRCGRRRRALRNCG